MPNTTFIYALCEPGSRTVRYIGKSNDPRCRLKYGHLLDSVTRNTHLGRWLKRIARNKQAPNLLILAEVSRRSWKSEERRYIAAARMLGMYLVNSTDGGEGITMTPETRRKIGASLRGNPLGASGKCGPASPVFGIKHKGASSKFLGVSRYCDSSGYKSWVLNVCGRYLGYFKLEIDAAKAYDKAVRKLFGRKAKTNFPTKRRD